MGYNTILSSLYRVCQKTRRRLKKLLLDSLTWRTCCHVGCIICIITFDNFETPDYWISCACFNPLAPEFYISVLAHPVCKMRIIQEPNMVALWNKRHFEEKTERRVCSIFKIFITCIYKEPTWCNLAVCLLVTAVILYMFRTLFAPILRNTWKL